MLVVVDGEDGKEYDGILEGTPVFSPDSRRVAYGARRRDKHLVVVDGVEGKEHDGFLRGSTIVFGNPRSLHTLAVRASELFRAHIECR